MRQVCRRQPGRLRTEEQRITGPVVELSVPDLTPGVEGEDAPRQLGETGVQVGVNAHLSQVMIVQAGSTDVLIVEVEAQGFHQVQVRPGAGAHADGVAGVSWDDRVIEDDMQF